MKLRRRTVAVGVVAVVAVSGAGAVGGFSVSTALDGGGRGRALVVARNADGPARPGAAGAGDVYFPDYGNGGYDVGHYTLRIRYDPGGRRFDGRAELAMTAIHSLTQFNLDFTGPDITALRVDGTAAAWRREGGHELVVTPPAPLAAGRAFRVEVEYGGAASGDAFHLTADGAVVLGEPEGAAAWYPANDHPTDKATYDFEITVPDGLSAIANGVSGGSSLDGGWRTWKWSARTALAPYLSMFVVGRFRTFEGTHDGVPVFSAVDERLPAGGIADQAVQRTPEVVDFLSSQFGPYPFEALGGVVTGEDQMAFALETQTRPVYAPVFFDSLSGATAIVAHELAHQWFGDSVALEQWRDIWLNEGFATYAQWLWEEHAGGRTVQRIFDEAYRAPETAEFWRPPPGDPGRQSLFASSVYVRGALTVHALRLTIGDDAFFRLLKEWTASRRGGNGTVADFVGLAERTGGRQLDDFFQAWLYREPKPPPPGR